MNKPSIIFILLLCLLSFSLISVSAQIITTIEGNASVYSCESYDYNITLTNDSVSGIASDIEFNVSFPNGFNVTNPIKYQLVNPLGPGESNKTKISLTTACSPEVGNIAVYGEFNNSPTILFGNTKSISPFVGAVTIEKTPLVTKATLGDIVTWKIKVKSTGLGPVKNVLVTDIFESGLKYVSSDPIGTEINSSKYSWNLETMAANQEANITVTAEVIDCFNLSDIARVNWGCSTTPPYCIDPYQETIASIQFDPDPPKIDYTIPPLDIAYCGPGNNFTIPITNTGGTAYDFNLSADFGDLIVNVISPSDVKYRASSKDFNLGDVPNGTTNLTFQLSPQGEIWCADDLPNGEVLFEPEYKYCDAFFYPPVKFQNYSISNIPTVSVTKTGAPDQVYLGDAGVNITYIINANYSNPGTTTCPGASTNFRVVDTIPTEFSIVDANGGTIDGNTITWDISPATSFSKSITLKSPSYSQCQFCGTDAVNTVTATVTDCCGCTKSVSSSQSTILECSENLTSNKTVFSNYNYEKCTPIEYTNTYNFANDGFWDDVYIKDLKFREELDNSQVLEGEVKIEINGSCTVYYSPPASTYLDVNFSDPNLQTLISACGGINADASVRNTDLSIEYNLSNQINPNCTSTSNFFDWSTLNTGKTGGSGCYGSSQIQDGVFVTVNGAHMNVDISGIPRITSKCETFIVRLNINRDSTGSAYDVNVSLPTSQYTINNIISYNGHTPDVVFDSGEYKWKYGDFFESNTNASIDLNVTLGCNSNGEMTSTVYWHDRCSNDKSVVACSYPDTDKPRLILSGNICVFKTPEILWIDENTPTWTICLTNTGSGNASNVWAQDILQSGLSFNSVSGTYSYVDSNKDRFGNTINGATVYINKIKAGDQAKFLLTANLDSCDQNLRNDVCSSYGCLGSDCQIPEEDYSIVRRPPSSAITTNILPGNGIAMCDQEPISIIVKNTGLTSVYDVEVYVYLPTELTYVSGSGVPNDPENITSYPLKWTKNEIPGLSELKAAGKPGNSLTITFEVSTACEANPVVQTISSEAKFRSPCGDIVDAPKSDTPISRRYPNITIAKTGRNQATQPSFVENVVANVSDTVIWKVTLTNNGNAPTEVLKLWDNFPSNFSMNTPNGISPAPISGEGTSGNPWILNNINPGISVDYYITGRVVGCGADAQNTAHSSWGCTGDTCRLASPNSAILITNPNITIPTHTIGTFTTCDGEITLRIRNGDNRPNARNVQVKYTLPAGYTFDYMLDGGPDPSSFDVQNNPIWNISSIPGNTIITLKFKLISNALCDSTVIRTSKVDVDYQNSCVNNLTTVTDSKTFTPLKPNLTIEKSPAIQVVGVQGQANWTITVTNTGSTSANNVSIVDILSNDWDVSTIIAGNGSNGEVPIIGANTIRWNVTNPIPASTGTWTTTLSARLINLAGTGKNNASVEGKCLSGCTYSSAADTATIWNLEGIAKTSRKQTATIGEEVIFDIAVNYHGNGSVYRDTLISDILPGGLGYVSHTFFETNASIPYPFTNVDPLLQWMLGTPSGSPGRTFTGPNSVQIVLTTKIKDIPGNVNGVTLINPVNTTFLQDGIQGSFSDDANVAIVEPNLTITKEGNGSLVSPGVTQALPGQSIHYTLTVTNIGTSPAYDITIQDVVPDGLIIDLSSITSSPNADSQGVLVGTNTIQWRYINSNAIAANGGTVVLQYNATVPQRGGRFTNTATNVVYSSLPGDVPGERIYPPGSDQWEVETPGTDLTKLTLNTDVDIPSPGGVVLYSLTIENSGALPLNPVQLVDILPDGLTYISDSADINGTFSNPIILQNPNGTETLTWNNLNSIIGQPEMPVGQFIIVKFQARVDPGRIGTFINEAIVTGTVVGLGDVTDNDESPVGVKKPAINITKYVEPPYGKVGFENQFTLKVTNTGEVPLNPVSVVDTLPLGLTYAGGANMDPDSVILNGDGTTTITWNNTGALAVGESRLVIFSAKFNGYENKSINKATTTGQPPNGDTVTDDDQVEILKKTGANPKETLRIITKGYMKRCDLCYSRDLAKEARNLITNQNVLDEDDTCCRPDDIIEELKIEVTKKGLDKDPRYLRAVELIDKADELCEEAQNAYDKGNYGLAQRLTKEKCEAIGESMRLLIEVLS